MKCFVAVLPLLAVAAMADKVDPYAAPAPKYANPAPYNPPKYDAPAYNPPKYNAPEPKYAPAPAYKQPEPSYKQPEPSYQPAPAPKYDASKPSYKPAPAPKYDAPKVVYKPAPAPAPKYDAPKPAYKPEPKYRPAPQQYKPAPVQYRPAPQYAPAAYKPGHKEEEYAPPQPYEYQYGVADDYTGTQYKAIESQDASGAVVGSYTVNLPDGRVQTVTYHTDEYGGFHADVAYEGEAVFPPEPEEGYGNSYKKHEKRPTYAKPQYQPKPQYAPAPSKHQ